MKGLCLVAALALVSPCLGRDRWELQYFFDEDNAALTISDLKFPSPSRGIATGQIARQGGIQPAVLVTNDGGRTWTQVKFKQAGLSLFFLNESIGWVVTDRAIWKTVESGRNWRKLPKSPDGVLRVHFLDENHGWAVGTHKSVWETSDGGSHWTAVSAAGDVKGNPDFTYFSWVDFTEDGRFGVIAGVSTPPRRGAGRFPDWMDPEAASSRREWPALNLFLETRDSGKSWVASSSSIFGRITRVRLAEDGLGLGLIEFFNSFDWPSEVFELQWRTGKSSRVFRRADTAVTDVVVLSGGVGYLAAFEPGGELVRSPIPGRVKIFRSTGLKDWEEMDVDYRATARRVVFAAAGPQHIWAATDTGMILRLVSDSPR